MTVENWLMDNAPGWDNLSAEEKQVLRDFPVLWAFFEAWLSHPRTANSRQIGLKIDALRDDSIPQALPALNAAFLHYRNRFFRDGASTAEFRNAGLIEPTKTFVTRALQGAEPDQRTKLKAVLYIINRLRNNYLHGGKALYGFAGQLENFEHANATLMEFLPIVRPNE